MVDGDWFDELEEVARTVRGNQRPFGGIQLVLCGDFLQLPPVTKDKRMKFTFEAQSWSRCVQECVILKEVHRQKDQDFIDLLGRVRYGRCSDDDVRTLQATTHHNLDDGNVQATRLCTHVKEAELINTSKLASLGGVAKTFYAQDVSGDPRASAVLKSSCRAPTKLCLKAGAQVMLTKNISVAQGLANGSRGVVVGFSNSGLPIVRFVSGVKQAMHLETWTVGLGAGRTVSRRQLPLQLAWSVSIHKSQGMTLDAVELDLSKVFEYGQAYVALSRATSLGGLRVKNFKAGCVRAHPSVLRFYQSIED